jgi:C4-dicarboxylate-specific signal transduction histidine kinase
MRADMPQAKQWGRLPMPGKRAFVTMDLAIAIAVSVFLIDLLTKLHGAIAVLYIVVPLLVATAYSERVVVGSGIVCAALATIAFLSQHYGEDLGSAYTRFGVSIAALLVTTYLAFRQKRISADLERSERRYRTIFHAAGFAAWESNWSQLRRSLLASLDGYAGDKEAWLAAHPKEVRRAVSKSMLQEVNQAAIKLFEASSAEQLVSKSVIMRYPPGQAFARMFAELLDGKEVAEAEAQARTVNGRRLDIVMRVTLAQEGEPWSRALITAFDETERKEAREKLEQISADLAHAGRISMVGQLTASIAHEVNQPLTAIVAYGKSAKRWLDREQPDLAETEQCLDKIVANGTRAADVIARIRSLVRKAPINAEAVDLGQLIDETVMLVLDEAKAANVWIDCGGRAGVRTVWADRVQIQQVFANLLLNSIQAMQGVHDRDRRIIVTTRNHVDSMVQIEVADNGSGIANPSQLFTPFVTTKAGGMGMGLSISRSIVEAQGGRMEARNNPDHGATFSFLLPSEAAVEQEQMQTSV